MVIERDSDREPDEADGDEEVLLDLDGVHPLRHLGRKGKWGSE